MTTESVVDLGVGPENDPLTKPVITKYGKVIGRRIIHKGDRQVNAFQGIPYAQAPIKNLRFKNSKPPIPWMHALKTTKFKARPIQKDESPTDQYTLPPQSEDCLQLNVFTPAWNPESDQLFPVMVFIHGGGFVFDSVVKYGDIGICKYLVAECETVVVTVEYRLGFLGFFSTGDSTCDDNVGLWDMIMALRWVKENIQAFRGDPNNVTLFGQSAGGCAVDMLSVSPEARGLFQRVIPMSGNADCGWALTNNAIEKCRLMANKVGVNAVNTERRIAKLQDVPAKKFAVGFDDVNEEEEESPIVPRIGRSILPRPIAQLREEAPKMKRLIGLCKYEGIMYASNDLKLGELIAMIARLIPEANHSNFVELRKKALNFYISPDEYRNRDAVVRAWVECKSDTFMGISVQKNVLEQLRVNNEETYLYSFDYYNPESLFPDKPMKGATHCLDLNYLLYIFMFVKYKFNEKDMKVLRILTKLWTNFAKYGDPNGSSAVLESQFKDFKWLPVTAEHPSRYLSIGPNPKMRDNFQEGRPMFWIKFEEKCRRTKYMDEVPSIE